MSTERWQTKLMSVASLYLDPKNPRLGRETVARAPHEIIQYLFKHDKAMEVAESISRNGYFQNEPLLAVREAGKIVVVEGNRRLAALKALNEPDLLEKAQAKRIEVLSSNLFDSESTIRVPVTIAPNRRATDKQVAIRHVRTPILRWRTENQASFILAKLDEGYTDDALRDELGFSAKDLQDARATRAVADMARALDLSEAVKTKLNDPKTKIVTTIKRIFVLSVGREYMMVEPDIQHGIRGTTTKKQFIRGFSKLVTDIALGAITSRHLNTTKDVKKYFGTWKPEELPQKKRGSFIPSDIISRQSAKHSDQVAEENFLVSKQPLKAILPKSLRIPHGGERLIRIRKELIKLKRAEFPNAGAALLRVFFELTLVDYLTRTGEMDNLINELENKDALRHETPELKHMLLKAVEIAKIKLPRSKALTFEKAVRYDSAARFSISDFHSFVHGPSDLPTDDDLLQFWLRTETMFRFMLEHDPDKEES